MEARCQGSAENHRGGGGQLPRDAGPPAHPAGAPSVPGALDPGENNVRWLVCLTQFVKNRFKLHGADEDASM